MDIRLYTCSLRFMFTDVVFQSMPLRVAFRADSALVRLHFEMAAHVHTQALGSLASKIAGFADVRFFRNMNGHVTL